MSDFENDDLLGEFLAESREHLAGIESDLLEIEASGADIDEELVNKVFRAAHSIKGGSGFFGLRTIQELAHKTETALSMIRSREMVPNPEVINILLQAFDRLRELFSDVSGSNNADIGEQLVALGGLNSSYLPPEAKADLESWTDLSFGNGALTAHVASIDVSRAAAVGKQLYLLRYDLIHDIEQAGRTPLTVLRELSLLGEILDAALHFDAVGTLNDEPVRAIPFDVVFATVMGPELAGAIALNASLPVNHVYIRDNVASVPQPAMPRPQPMAAPVPHPPVQQLAAEPEADAPVERTTAPAAGKTATAGSSGSDNTVRVNVSVLENLMNMASELVLSRNQLREALSTHDERAMVASSQRVSQVTTDLQEAVMQTRLQPVANVFSKFPRLIRDLARSLGKDIHLDMEGREVELDRTLIEGLSDPLTHMVRNAADHGIEMPEDRVSQGKNRQGKIRLHAFHAAGQVVIELADDGKGIDPARIANSALKKGLISPDKLAGMSDKEKMALIFLPGLSTSEIVSDVSGRGVGMDVVKTNLDRMGGKVDIESSPGKGSLFRIKLPLTLAIIPSLSVSAAGETFCVPQVNIVELLRIAADQVRGRIEIIGGSEVLVLRGALIPLVRLNDVVGLESDENRETPEDLHVVVISTGTLQYGLIVDHLHNTEEIVVKPLGRHLKGIPEYAGATIMGDGGVALILDASGVAAKADLSLVTEEIRRHENETTSHADARSEQHSLLLFNNAQNEACAVPLSLVIRVERVESRQIETIGGKRTLQYRGASLPVVTLADSANVHALSEEQEWTVIVFRAGEHEIGLLGAMPVDVVETEVDIDQVTLRQPGISGSAVIHERTTLMVDLHELVEAVFPDYAAHFQANVTDARQRAVLLAEDSDYFRAQVKRYLESDGYQVIDAPDGEAAWEMLMENAEAVDAVVTDIEMPRLSGLGLTQRIRADGRFANLPIVGLTSLASEDDIARGKAAGISDYQIKLDRDRLLEALHGYLGAIRKTINQTTDTEITLSC